MLLLFVEVVRILDILTLQVTNKKFLVSLLRPILQQNRKKTVISWEKLETKQQVVSITHYPGLYIPITASPSNLLLSESHTTPRFLFHILPWLVSVRGFMHINVGSPSTMMCTDTSTVHTPLPEPLRAWMVFFNWEKHSLPTASPLASVRPAQRRGKVLWTGGKVEVFTRLD